MGQICTCGVLVNAVSCDNNVRFAGHIGTVKGDLTYMANVCDTTMSTSTLYLEFTDKQTHGCRYSFEFVSETITAVVCRQEGMDCEITVRGTGVVGGRVFPFEAVFRDQVEAANYDIVQSFVITGFFDQDGAAPVPQGSIFAIGCE